jgi:hypothetical protein
MRKLKSIDGLRRRLLRNGLPAAYVMRATRELEEHREDLLEELRGEGVVGTAAELKVAERLGNFDVLATHLTGSMRRSNWCGRHPVVTFCLLPLLSFFAAFALVLAMIAGVAEVAGWLEPKPKLSPGQWAWVTGLVHVLRWSLFAAIPFWFCWLARSTFCGYRWGLATCLVFSVHGLLHRLKIVAPVTGGDGSLAWGYGTRFDWMGLSVPLVIFALFVILSKHTNASEMRQQQASA